MNGRKKAGQDMSDPKNLIDCGQSYWLDNLTREMLDNGELEENIRWRGLRGMTSNPKTFSKAISSGESYDSQIRDLVHEGRPVESIYETLAVTDVRRACDLFRPLYDDSGGADGFVSLEVSPYLAHDTAGTMEEVRRLHGEVDRPNVMIKIPGTVAGLDAIEEMLFEGVNVNITLLFAVERYAAVAERYLRALERRLGAGRPVDRIASVASFFLSRIDVLCDRLLGQRIVPGLTNGRPPETLFGELAIVSAKLAYREFQRIFGGSRFARLADRGASAQRLLWASTSTKNACYSDVKYVEPLIGRQTVNTMPKRTIQAFRDHGVIRENTIEENLDAAELVVREIAATGLDVREIAWQLEHEGVEKFITPLDGLMATLGAKRQEMLNVAPLELGRRQPSAAEPIMGALQEMQLGRRLYQKDPWIWTREPSEAEEISHRLGWIDSPRAFRERMGELRDFAEVVRARYDRVLVLGMGGSSLAASMGSAIFGARPGFPEVKVLDSTHPAELDSAERWIEPERSLFIVASKSGTTMETTTVYRYFYELTVRATGNGAGSHFVAITDPGSPLADEAHAKRFLRLFENPPDIGGRYSALSYFGLVPMAIMGVDVGELLARARELAISCGPALPVQNNPALKLGAFLASGAREGRNKVTFIPRGSADAFAQWAEQLLAESTGKGGEGLVPVVGESLGEPEVYGEDRVFVSLSLRDRAPDTQLDALERAGHPVIRIGLDDLLDLGAEYLRWELATAAAGAVLDINPFDEPNVQESKENTRRLLEEWKSTGKLDGGSLLLEDGQIEIFAHEGGDWLQNVVHDGPLPQLLESFLRLGRPGDYLSLLAYLPDSPEIHRQLQMLRLAFRDQLKIATTLGYGPRYLHSTGQLHKGGPDEGLFLFFTEDTDMVRGIPGESYGFETLLRAQALADFQALNDKGRRAMRVHFGKGATGGLEEIMSSLFGSSMNGA